MDNKIDFVIAWVDGSDEEWKRERDIYLEQVSGKKLNNTDTHEARYRDWDNLKYWFRAVEKYAPFVNKIYFVTWGHVPEWLDTNNQKLVIVNHKDFIPEKYLPTFNSHTIELNLHRIKGLSEQFVYFNDDMFINAEVKSEDFFKNGLPLDTFGLEAVYFSKGSAGWYNGNNLEVINNNINFRKMQKKYTFKKWLKLRYGISKNFKTASMIFYSWFPGFYYDHVATNLLKSTMEEVWKLEPDILDRTCMDKFRSRDNVNQWVFKYYQLAKGNFYPRSYKFSKCFHIREELSFDLLNTIRNHKVKMICLNDTDRTTDFEVKKNLINKAFESAYPEKSSFEK